MIATIQDSDERPANPTLLPTPPPTRSPIRLAWRFLRRSARSAARRVRGWLRDTDLYDVGHGAGCRCERCKDKRWWGDQW